ncbi:hypothetical protein [Desulfovibrio legallii]|nr:hypothetical protein [Desulfovibrio legallii]
MTFLQAKRQRRDPRAFALGKQVEPAVNPYFFARRRKGNLPLAQTAVA